MNLNKLFTTFLNKQTMILRVKVFLWYYRILHSTFGGVTITSAGEVGVNVWLKYYGVLFGLLMGAANCLSVYLYLSTPLMQDLYNDGFTVNFYLSLS